MREKATRGEKGKTKAPWRVNLKRCKPRGKRG
jgi:hypothetical protein